MLEDGERLPALIESLAAPDPEEARIPISQYLWIVKRHRWRILGFCAAAAIATVIISARLTPIFESTTTVDVDRRTPPGVVGPEAALSAVNDADQFLSTQMKLVQSDGVLRPVGALPAAAERGTIVGGIRMGRGYADRAQAVAGHASAQYVLDAHQLSLGRSAVGG